MDRQRFTEAYTRKPSAAFFHTLGSEAISNAIRPFDEWDERLGDALYEALSSEDKRAQNVRQLLQGYGAHSLTQSAHKAQENITDTIIDSGIDDPYSVASKALNEHNFHVMSQLFQPMWRDMLGGEPVGRMKHEKEHHAVMLGLALAALDYAEIRGRMSSISSGHAYFDEEHRVQRDTINGILTEIDAAIAFVELSRTNPDITVVPAPRRFEHADRQTNADFIIYDKSTDEAVGAQLKTNVTDADRARYDKDRIVLLSSTEDLGGKVWARVKSGSSDTQYVAWPGMVATQYIQSIPMHGKKNAAMESFNPRVLLNIKHMTKLLLTPPYDNRKVISEPLPKIKQKIQAKIMPYLRSDHDTESAS